MTFYEATFGDETCYVRVESRPSGRGAVFVATPYVLDTEILYWFPNGHGRAIEVPGASEEAVLWIVARFLRLGSVHRLPHLCRPTRECLRTS